MCHLRVRTTGMGTKEILPKSHGDRKKLAEAVSCYRIGATVTSWATTLHKRLGKIWEASKLSRFVKQSEEDQT
jgi:hypothetical protein